MPALWADRKRPGLVQIDHLQKGFPCASILLLVRKSFVARTSVAASVIQNLPSKLVNIKNKDLIMQNILDYGIPDSIIAVVLVIFTSTKNKDTY